MKTTITTIHCVTIEGKRKKIEIIRTCSAWLGLKSSIWITGGFFSKLCHSCFSSQSRCFVSSLIFHFRFCQFEIFKILPAKFTLSQAVVCEYRFRPWDRNFISTSRNIYRRFFFHLFFLFCSFSFYFFSVSVSLFLDASSHFYGRFGPPVRPYVRLSFRPSAFQQNCQKSQKRGGKHCSCIC